MVNFAQYCVDEATTFIRSMRHALWFVAEEAERSRSRFRVRREQQSLAAREAACYRRLGAMGFELLSEQVAMTRTPEIATILDEARRCSEACADRESLLESNIEALSKTDWQRLAHQLAQQRCVLRWIRLSPRMAFCQRVDVGTPAGLCVAMRRNDRILPVPSDGIGRQGDELLIVAPIVTIPQWELWAGNSSASHVD